MIRLFFEITERGPTVVVYGSKEYTRKTPTEEYLAEIMMPMCRKILTEMSTVQRALGPDITGKYVQIPGDAPRPVLIGDTGIALHSKDGPAILCLRCGRISHNPKDVEHKYCGACHRFHDQ